VVISDFFACWEDDVDIGLVLESAYFADDDFVCEIAEIGFDTCYFQPLEFKYLVVG
jgi:hypothetical protein